MPSPDPLAPVLAAVRAAGGAFVTGTDTGVGKTLIAGAIARSLRHRKRTVEVFKPVATGCRSVRGQLVSQDAEFLAACAGSPRLLSEVCPVRYRTAVAPNVAGERERRPVDLEAIFAEYRRLATSPLVIVEGVGGLLCPISDDFWVIHLAKMMALPLVIVARAGLGTINHTLLTIHAARSAGLKVAGVVLNRYRIEPQAGKDQGAGHAPTGIRRDEMGSTPSMPAGPACSQDARPTERGDEDMSMFTNPAQIEARGRVKVLALVPEEKESSVEEARVGPDVQFAVDQVDWETLTA